MRILKLATINLFVSQAIALIFLAFAYFYWFPFSLSEVTGLNKNAKTLILVNLVLGPLLILLIVKNNSKNIKLDIFLLLALQLSAFLFGIYSIAEKRPIFAVFTIDRFTLVNAHTVSLDKDRFREYGLSLLSKPKFAFAKMPSDLKLRNKILSEHMFEGAPDLDGRPQFYEIYSDNINSILNRSIPVDNILNTYSNKNKVNTFLKKHGGKVENYAYLPIQTDSQSAIWALDKQTAKPIALINIDPWELASSTDKQQNTNVRRWLAKI